MLKDLKILDFTTLLPGPFATWQLAEMGADILKVSAPNKPDLVLEMGPKTPGGVNANKVWLQNKKDEIFVDLKDEKGIEEIHRLLKEEGYNVIIEQFRPGVMAKLGLSYEDVKKIKEDIIYVSLSGYGQTGEYKDRAGHDINYLSLSGLMSYSGRKEGGPVLNGMQIADIISSYNAMLGILAAHNNRIATGEGKFVDVGILDGLIPFHAMTGAGVLVDPVDPERESQWLNGGSLYDFYETKDGGYMSVGSLEPKFWKTFCEVIGKEDWIKAGCVCDDAQEKKVELREIFKTKTRDEWTEIFGDKDCCVEPVLTATEALLKDKNTETRQGVQTINYEGEEVKVYGNPIKFRD